MSLHGQVSRQQQLTQKINDESTNAVDCVASGETSPAGILRTCLDMERLPKKLRKRQGHSNLKSTTPQSTHPEPSGKSASLYLGAKRSLRQRTTSQSSGVSSSAKIPFPYLFLTRKRLISGSGVPESSNPVADGQFTTPFDLGAGLPDPLRSNPPFLQTRVQKSPSWRKMPFGAERLDKDMQEPSGIVEETGEFLPEPYILLVDANKRLQEETRQLNSALHELTSERVLLADEVASLRKNSKATEDALLTLWALFKPHSPGLNDVKSVPDVRNAIKKLCREGVQEGPTGTCGAASGAGNQRQPSIGLEEELIQQTRFLEHFRKSETVARKNVHKLSMENKKLRTQLSEGEANKQLLQARLEAVERRFRRLEEHILQNTWV